MYRDIHDNYSNGQLGSFMHRGISTEYHTFIGRSGDGKRGRGGATRESGTHYGGRVCNRLANLRACLRGKRTIEPTSGYGLDHLPLRLAQAGRPFLGFTMLATFRGREGFNLTRRPPTLHSGTDLCEAVSLASRLASCSLSCSEMHGGMRHQTKGCHHIHDHLRSSLLLHVFLPVSPPFAPASHFCLSLGKVPHIWPRK